MPWAKVMVVRLNMAEVLVGEVAAIVIWVDCVYSRASRFLIRV